MVLTSALPGEAAKILTVGPTFRVSDSEHCDEASEFASFLKKK